MKIKTTLIFLKNSNKESKSFLKQENKLHLKFRPLILYLEALCSGTIDLHEFLKYSDMSIRKFWHQTREACKHGFCKLFFSQKGLNIVVSTSEDVISDLYGFCIVGMKDTDRIKDFLSTDCRMFNLLEPFSDGSRARIYSDIDEEYIYNKNLILSLLYIKNQPYSEGISVDRGCKGKDPTEKIHKETDSLNTNPKGRWQALLAQDGVEPSCHASQSSACYALRAWLVSLIQNVRHLEKSSKIKLKKAISVRSGPKKPPRRPFKGPRRPRKEKDDSKVYARILTQPKPNETILFLDQFRSIFQKKHRNIHKKRVSKSTNTENKKTQREEKKKQEKNFKPHSPQLIKNIESLDVSEDLKKYLTNRVEESQAETYINVSSKMNIHTDLETVLWGFIHRGVRYKVKQEVDPFKSHMDREKQQLETYRKAQQLQKIYKEYFEKTCGDFKIEIICHERIEIKNKNMSLSVFFKCKDFKKSFVDMLKQFSLPLPNEIYAILHAA